MSINHKKPRQDRRGIGRAPIKKHNGQHSVGTKQPNDAFHNPGSPKATRMALLSQQGQFSTRN